MKDLADAAGVSVNSVSRYLNNTSTIPLDVFAALCEELGEMPSTVMSRAVERIPDQDR